MIPRPIPNILFAMDLALAVLAASTQATITIATHQRWLQVIGSWIERSRQHRALANLYDWFLNDVGSTRSAAAREIAKPFWR